jgi:DMSO/TMAO reductase YedYZ molybdopterin-dependent catalytic subunit
MTRSATSTDGRRTLLPPALAGALAAGAALAVAELAAGLLGAVSSPLQLVGDRVIDTVPPAVEDAAIAVFGTADKAALQVGTVIVGMLAGAGLGVVAQRRWVPAALGFTVIAALGALAALPDPRASVLSIAVAVTAGLAAGLTLLRWLTAVDVRNPSSAAPVDGDDGAAPAALDRRGLLVAGGVAAVAVVAGGAGRWLLQRRGVADARSAVRLPPPADPLPPVPDAATLEVDGLTPLFVPNDRFYRIDTALSVPQVDPEGWRLRVTGLVERPLTLSFDDLRRRADQEADVTIACVSNEVGGGLVGNARWQGTALRGLLEEAGVRPEAAQVVGRSVDGFTAAFPVEAALDGRAALVAIGMNGRPLPLQHGFPARLVVPGLYGYVSATKWLSEIELVTEDFEGYWVPRGWAKRAPVKTQSRIDVPRQGASVSAGRVAVAGVAWAPTRGISAVEVKVDDGPWRSARLSESIGRDSWRQWVWQWEATEGRHRLTVRATDGRGRVQTAESVPPRPDGATGHHTISVDVSAT